MKTLRCVSGRSLWIAVWALAACALPANAVLTTSHVPNAATALTVANASGGAVRVTAEARIGGRGDWELGLRRDPLTLDGTSVTANFDAWTNGVPIPFILAYDGRNTITLTLALSTVANRSSFSVAGDFNELFIPTRAVGANTSIVVGNLFLNGAPVAGSSSAINQGTDTQDVLRIQGAPLSRAFLLAGTITLRWSGAKPTGSRLDGQFWLARVVTSPDTTAPAVTMTSPAAGSLLATATPTIAATFADSGSGIDPATIRLTLDGADRTGEAQASASGLTFTPSSPLGEGGHSAEVRVRDRSGNEGGAARSFVTDSQPPAIVFTAPPPEVTSDPAPAVSLAYSDATSGIDLATVRVTLDGTPLTACSAGVSSADCRPSALAAGSHALAATVRDRAGHEAAASSTFHLTLDVDPPSIVLTAPLDGGFVNASPVLVSGSVSDDGQVASVSVNGTEVQLVNGAFQIPVALTEGFNEILVLATDATGKLGTASRTVRLDLSPPRIAVKTPAPGQLSNAGEIRVAGEVTDDAAIGDVRVQGSVVSLADGRFETSVPLASGANQISVRALDLAGNEAVATVQVTRFDLPEVTITSPRDLSFLASTTVSVSGTVSDPAARVTVNGVAATVSGNSFDAPDVPLLEGGNILTATAGSDGHVASATINVVRDLQPPRLAVQDPADGAVLFDSTVTVSGLVNDIVAGTVNASQVTVTVNGRPARVANRSFVVPGVPLAPGENVLTVVATDVSGNVGQAQIRVRREEPAGPRISIRSGDLQEEVIGTDLPQPLVVVLRDAAGLPAPGRPVLFKVKGSDGSLDGGRRQIAVTTDASGQAAAHFKLGTRAGVGSQGVLASSAGFQGPVLFRQTARPGVPVFLVVDSGDQQVGVAGRLLPRPLVAVVTDPGYNRLEGMAVKFTVTQGRGKFENGLQEALVFSDSDGRLIVPFALDPEEGIANNVVEARIDGLETGPVASFVATGRAAGDAAATSISGVVLDNASQPIAGVTLRVLDSPLTARTDAQGLFKIPGAPVGTVKLIVDGSTVERPGSWPDLEYVLTTVPGRDNTPNMPIYLLPLDLRNGIAVDETHGGVLALPEIPGFALEIAPGTVTFPGGSRSGVVSVTAVHSDKVPMVPNFGQQPRFIVTIQPAGARFDPPARLTLPNLEGLAPGAVTEMYSFDHDLGHFVSIGPATVSEDGTVIVSNPGVGVIKAGWHCGGNPTGLGITHNCPTCLQCVNGRCAPDPKALCKSCATGKACDGDGNCLAGIGLIPKICSQLDVLIENRQPIRPNDPRLEGKITCQPDYCYGGIVEDLTRVTHSCDHVSLLGAFLTEEVESTSSNGCPDFQVGIGYGCRVGPDNKLVKLSNNSGACSDAHVVCAPAELFPMGTCTITHHQRLYVDGCMAVERTVVFTFTRLADGCLPAIVQ